MYLQQDVKKTLSTYKGTKKGKNCLRSKLEFKILYNKKKENIANGLNFELGRMVCMVIASAQRDQIKMQRRK